MRKLNIGIFNHSFINGSGIDNVIKDHANFLIKYHDVEINTFFADRTDCKAKINILSDAKTKSVFNAHKPADALRMIRQIKRYDVVMSHIYPANLLTALGSKIYSVPHLAYFWGAPPLFMLDNFPEKLYHFYLHLTEILVPKLGVTKSLVPNEFIKQRNKNKKAEILPLHGVNIKRFSPNNVNKRILDKLVKKHKLPKNAKILFMLGRVTPYKGVDLMIRVHNKVIQKIPNSYFLIGGKPWNKQYQDYLKSIANKNVIFLGLVPEEEIVEYYALTDVYISGSKWEGLLCAEPFGLKKPYVAFDSTANKYTVTDGVTGYLAKPFDIDEFAKKTIELLKNDKKRREFGEAAYEWVKNNLDYSLLIKKLKVELENLAK